jgi:DNA polymerase III sliding clamp (beta) subunit (PCNA family)
VIVETKVLKAALSRLAATQQRTRTIGCIGNVRFEATGDGMVTALATDMNAWVEVKMRCVGDLEPCLIPFKTLNSMIPYAGDSVSILALGLPEIAIESGWTWKSRKVDVSEFPKFPESPVIQVGVAPDIMADALEGVSWASKPEDADFDPKKRAIFVKGEPKNLFMAGYGGPKCCAFEQAIICSDFISEVPTDFAEALAEHLCEEDAKLSIGPNFWEVRHSNGSIAVKLQEDSWGEGIQKHLPKDSEPVAEIDREEWISHILAAQAVNPNDGLKGGIIAHVIEGESVLLRSDGLTGNYEAEMPGALASAKFSVSGNYLLEGLRNCDEDKISLMVSPNAIYWRHGNYFTMIAPIRIGE